LGGANHDNSQLGHGRLGCGELPNALETCEFSMAFTPAPMREELAWQWPVPSTGVDSLTQNFARYSDYKTNFYHSGVDVGSGGQGLEVRPIRSGRVAFIQENGGRLRPDYTCDETRKSPKDVGSNCADHGMGNTVIVEHVLHDGSVVYSQYSHLETIDQVLTTRCGPRDDLTYRRVCAGELLDIGRSQRLGTVGGSGFGLPARWDIHLHFELKKKPFLGSSSSTHDAGEWGYTKDDPELSNYLDPLAAMHSAELFLGSYPAMFLSSSPMRDGPGQFDLVDYPTINTTDAYVGSSLVAVAHSAPTLGCRESWLKLKPARQETPTSCKVKGACFKTSQKASRWETPFAWVCASSVKLY
jgi:hypothetical protein